jgi:hypothetical protein
MCVNSVIVVSPHSFSFRIRIFDEYRGGLVYGKLVFGKYVDCASLERGCSSSRSLWLVLIANSIFH